jgi:hypothetical protein
MANAKATSGRDKAFLLSLAAGGLAFFVIMANVHRAAGWDVRPIVYVGDALLAFVGVLLLFRGLATLRAKERGTGMSDEGER